MVFLHFLHFLCFCHWCSLFFCWFSCILLTFLWFSLAFLAFPLACPACSSLFPICSWILLALLLFVICHPSFSLVVHVVYWFSSGQSLLLRSLLLVLVLLFLLLLLLLLLTYGMMALKIKSGRGVGGRAQRLPPKALGGSRCSVPLPCCCSLVGFVVAGFVLYSSCCWLFCRYLEKHRSR